MELKGITVFFHIVKNIWGDNQPNIWTRATAHWVMLSSPDPEYDEVFPVSRIGLKHEKTMECFVD